MYFLQLYFYERYCLQSPHTWSCLTSPVSSPKLSLQWNFVLISHPLPSAEDPSSKDEESPLHTSSRSLELSQETWSQSGCSLWTCCSWVQPASVGWSCKRRICPLPAVSKQAVRWWRFLASSKTLKRNTSEVKNLFISVMLWLIICKDLPRHVGTASIAFPWLDMIRVSG